MSLIDDFLADLELRNIGTTPIYTLYAGEFCTFPASRGNEPADVGRDDLKAFLSVLRARGVKFSSQERVFSILVQFYSYMVEEELIASNPIPSFTKRYLSPIQRGKGYVACVHLSGHLCPIGIPAIHPSRQRRRCLEG